MFKRINRGRISHSLRHSQFFCAMCETVQSRIASTHTQMCFTRHSWLCQVKMAAAEIRSNTVKSVSVGLRRNPTIIPFLMIPRQDGRDGRGLGHRDEWRRQRGETAHETRASGAFYERWGGTTVQKEIDAPKHVVRSHRPACSSCSGYI